MKAYDTQRVNRKKRQEKLTPKKKLKIPENNIPVVIRKGLVVFTNCKSKIEGIRIKYATL